MYFFYDRGTRNKANSFFICIIDYSLPNSVVDKGRNNNFLGWPGSSITTGKQVQYKIDDGIYTVTYDDPYVLRGEDFERIYAALMDSKDVDISLKSNNLYYLFTVHGIGFSDLVSSVQ